MIFLRQWNASPAVVITILALQCVRTSIASLQLTNFIQAYNNITLSIQYSEIVDAVEINFSGYDREFNVYLREMEDKNLSKGIKVNLHGSDTRTFYYKPNTFYYKGHLKNEYSLVHGRLEDGNFDGVIHSENDTFFIEPCIEYFRRCGLYSHVIYREQDIEFWTKTQAKWGSKSLYKTPGFTAKPRSQIPKTFSNFKYYQRPPVYGRRKGSILSDTASLCELHVVVDHTYYHIKGGGQVSKTISEVQYHITEASAIFRETDFNMDNYGDNIAFAVREITIYETPFANQYLMGSMRLTVDKYLDILSTYDFNDFCLAVSFTHRDYDGGVIGLAWLATPAPYSSPGGLCQKRIYYHDRKKYNGYYSFNTLLISTLNFGHKIPKQVSALTLTHEFGHSFGSVHDEPGDKVCAPGGLYGDFVMHPYSSNADKPNNRLFSPCSLDTIANVVAVKGVCMQRKSGAICGNGYTEAGEECDCGYSPTCSVVDKCCTPASASRGCKLDAFTNAVCSPKIDGCCKSDCKVEEQGIECAPATGCSKQSLCDGVSPKCPQPQLLPDNTFCRGGEGICQSGRCSSIACQQNGLEDCQCTATRHDQCKICCSCANTTGADGGSACVPADWLGILSSSGSTMYREDGEPCDADRGHCVNNHLCLSVYRDFTGGDDDSLLDQNLWQLVVVWVKEYYMYFLITVSSISVGLFAFSRILEKKNLKSRNLFGRNIRTSQGSDGFQTESEDIIYRKACRVLSRMGESKDKISSLARMCSFFPSAPNNIVIHTLENCESEKAALKHLILWGYPVNKLVVDDEVITGIDHSVSTPTLQNYINRVHSEINNMSLSSSEVNFKFNKDSIHSLERR